MPAPTPPAVPSAAVYDTQSDAHAVVSSLLPSAFAPSPFEVGAGVTEPGAMSPPGSTGDPSAPAAGPMRADQSTPASEGRGPARDMVRAPVVAPQPDAPVSEPATKSAFEIDEEIRSQESSQAEHRDRQTFLVTMHYGDTETVAGGIMAAAAARVTVAVRHVTPGVEARLTLRLRGNFEMAPRVSVAMNDVRVGEVAFDPDGALSSLVVPTGLLTEGSNSITLSRASTAPADAGSLKAAIDAPR